ncbi:glutamate ligase domain-containing protein, partial [Patescibacteria group bacterium]
LPLFGEFIVSNALASSAAAHVLGIGLDKVKSGLSSFKISDHRMRVINFSKNITIIDDSYNNNPGAARAVLNAYKQISSKGYKVVIFGDMLELGDIEKEAHQEIGGLLGKMKLDYLVGVGQASRHLVDRAAKNMKRGSYFWCKSETKVADLIYPNIRANTMILIKGSRSVGLEKVVSQLSERLS